MSLLALGSYLILFIYYFVVIFRSKSFATQCLVLFFGVYYIFPPIVYFLLVPNTDYLTMSGEVIFKAMDLDTLNIVYINLLCAIFLSLIHLLCSGKVDQLNGSEFYFFGSEELCKINRMVSLILLLVIGINLYLIYRVGGFYNFYYGSDWYSRYSGGAMMIFVMNIKSLLPCFGVALSAILLKTPKYRIRSILMFILFLFLYVYGGSNRKFALICVFIYFSIAIDILNIKTARYVFISMIVALFFAFQALLLLRSSDFSIEAISSAFDTMGEVIIISEPIGTYSLILSLVGDIIRGDLGLGYFLDILKFPLLPFLSLLDFNQPNVARALGFHINGNENFTFFPTLILESIYNGGVFFSWLFLTLYSLLCGVVFRKIQRASDLISMIYWVVIFNVCFIQLIRGYSSVVIAYYILLTVFFSPIYLYLRRGSGKKTTRV
ncbi:O-antigen polymerase [Vibrio cyclitrophicus]|nr:O-antigen polymerase [Vibrio cyclitrophicus]PMI06551.1 hypothetical protein BCU52_17695 [Vibrio cyclitrophicus]